MRIRPRKQSKWLPTQSALKGYAQNCGHTNMSIHKNVKAKRAKRILQAKRVLRRVKFYSFTEYNLVKRTTVKLILYCKAVYLYIYVAYYSM